MSWWNPVDWVKGAVKTVGTVAKTVGGIASSVGGYIPVVGGTVAKVGGLVGKAGGFLSTVGGAAKAVGTSVGNYVSTPTVTTTPAESKKCFIANEVYGYGNVPLSFYKVRDRLPSFLVKTYYKSSPSLIWFVRKTHLHRQVKRLLDWIDSRL